MKAAARAVGIAANALTFTTLFFLFGHDIRPETRERFDAPLLAGFTLALLGLVLLIALARKKELGGGLVLLISLPLVMCGLLSVLRLAR